MSCPPALHPKINEIDGIVNHTIIRNGPAERDKYRNLIQICKIPGPEVVDLDKDVVSHHPDNANAR